MLIGLGRGLADTLMVSMITNAEWNSKGSNHKKCFKNKNTPKPWIIPYTKYIIN